MKPPRAPSLAAHLKSVLYLDRGILVLNKLPGLACQLTGERHRRTPAPGAPSRKEDMFNHLLAGLEKKYDLPSPVLPVHRLDIGTTGCLALATTPRSAQELSRQFTQGTIDKTYLALVRGGDRSFPTPSGRIEDRILYEDGYFAGYSEDGVRSVTEWKVLSTSPVAPVSLLELKLLTGNKHQLRIHLAKSLGAPILGDEKYSQKPISESITSQCPIPDGRVFLHASHLSLFRYRSGSGGHKRLRLGIQAPLPLDFTRICSNLQIAVPPLAVKGGVFVNGESRVEGDEEVPELRGRWVWQQQEAAELR